MTTQNSPSEQAETVTPITPGRMYVLQAQPGTPLGDAHRLKKSWEQQTGAKCVVLVGAAVVGMSDLEEIVDRVVSERLLEAQRQERAR